MILCSSGIEFSDTEGSKNIQQGNIKAKERTGRKGFRVRYMCRYTDRNFVFAVQYVDENEVDRPVPRQTQNY